MLKAICNAVFVLFCSLWCATVFAQEPIRIDRPKEGALVETELEVGGVATPGSTVEVWVDRVFIVDTVAEPDGWFVTRIKRPPNAADKSRIFVHELDAEGRRTSSAVVRIEWSDVPVEKEPVPPPPAVAVGEGGEGETGVIATIESGPPPEEEVNAAASAEPQPRAYRSGRVAVEYLVSVAAGISGAVIGVLLAAPFGDPGSGGRTAASVILGASGGSMAASGAVYGVGNAMQGNGSFAFTAVGGVAGAMLITVVALATDGNVGALWIPVGAVAFAGPVLGYELTSDTSRLQSDEPAAPAPQPTVSFSREGKPIIGFGFRW